MCIHLFYVYAIYMCVLNYMVLIVYLGMYCTLPECVRSMSANSPHIHISIPVFRYNG